MKPIHAVDRKIEMVRTKFASMTSTYCLGVFNDNFFKQAAMLLAVTLGLNHLQGIATLLFALPFILFSSIAGWAADRFSKKKVVIASKGVEFSAMLIGSAGLITGNWPCILAMVFLMGLQSTFFSPALNGSIPELYPESHVPRANGILKLVTTLAVLAGVACAGICLDIDFQTDAPLGSGAWITAGVAVVIALGGFITSFGTYSKPAAGAKVAFPKFGPISSIMDTIEICRDKQLLLAIIADSCFYFMASMVLLVVNVLGIQELGMSESMTSMLSVSLMIGICLGSLMVSRLIDMKKWSRYLALSSCTIGLALLLGASVGSLPNGMQFYWLAISLIATGLAGGFLIIPVASFLQTHPASSDKGRVLAASNFCTFCAILCSGIIFYVMDSIIAPSQMIGCVGGMAILTAVLLRTIRTLTGKHFKTIIAGISRAILSLRYDIEVKGFDQINKTGGRGIVFLPNHPALIDPLILMSILYEKFQPRSLSDEEQINKPFVRQAMKLINPILIPDVEKQGKNSRKRVFRALREVVKSLNDNEEILMYPSGRLYRSSRENLGGNSGVEYILKHAPQTRIILVRTTGLWGSSFSHAQNTRPSVHSSIGRVIAYFCANLIFFGPRRKVTVEFTENHTLKFLKDRREINPHLELFYNKTVQRNIHIPYYWWKGGGHRKLEEPQPICAHGNLKTMNAAAHKLVSQKTDETG